MRDPDRVALMDPLDALDGPCQVLDSETQYCLEL
jgi:hypothetical protein